MEVYQASDNQPHKDFLLDAIREMGFCLGLSACKHNSGSNVQQRAIVQRPNLDHGWPSHRSVGVDHPEHLVVHEQVIIRPCGVDVGVVAQAGM